MSTRRKASGPKRMIERVHWDEGLAKRAGKTGRMHV